MLSGVEEFVADVQARWSALNGRPTTPELIDLARRGTERFPQSAELWHLAGNLIDVLPIGESYPGLTARECYERAIELDPGFAEAWKDLGFWLDTYRDAFPEAEGALRRALALEPTDPEIYEGLSRVMAQAGRADEAVALLDGAPAEVRQDQNCMSTRNEIRDGIWSA